MLFQLCGFFVYEVKAETLGPLDFDGLDYEDMDSVIIHSPQNITYDSGPVFVNFTSIAVVPYQGNYVLGYSLDGGPVERITNFKGLGYEPTATPSFEWLTSLGNLTLSGLQTDMVL